MRYDVLYIIFKLYQIKFIKSYNFFDQKYFKGICFLHISGVSLELAITSEPKVQLNSKKKKQTNKQTKQNKTF